MFLKIHKEHETQGGKKDSYNSSLKLICFELGICLPSHGKHISNFLTKIKTIIIFSKCIYTKRKFLLHKHTEQLPHN